MLAVCLAMLEDADDREALTEIYYNYRNLMFYSAICVLKNQHDAEDCLSEAFIRISKNLDEILQLPIEKREPFFAIMTRNIAIDMARRTHGDVSEDEYPMHDLIGELDEGNQVVRAINSLSQKHRDVLYLRYIYGYSVQEISKFLKVTPAAIYRRLDLAKKELGMKLEGE